MTQYQRKVQKIWLNLQEGYSCLELQLQVPLRSYAGFFFTPSQHSSVNTHPGERLKNPELSRHASIIHATFLRAKCNLRYLLPKWSRCPGYSNHTGKRHQETDHGTFHWMLVLIVLAIRSQLKSKRTQFSSIFGTIGQNSKPHTRLDFAHCIII